MPWLTAWPGRPSAPLVKCAHGREHIIEADGFVEAGRLPQRWLVLDRHAVGRPGCEDGALHLRLAAGMLGDIKRVKKSGNRMRPDGPTFVSGSCTDPGTTGWHTTDVELIYTRTRGCW